MTPSLSTHVTLKNLFPGIGFLLIAMVAPISLRAQPANDLCANAEVVAEGIRTFDTTDANQDGPDLLNTNMDVWYRYTASSSGLVNISTCNSSGTSLQTTLAIYPDQACPPVFDSAIATNDGACGSCYGYDYDTSHSQVQFAVSVGDSILIQ